MDVEVIYEHSRCVERIRLYIERNEDCAGPYKLPSVPLKEDLNERELCSRFIDPFLSGLFDNPNQGIYLRWTNESTLEVKQLSNNTRPDLTITETAGLKWARSIGYGEPKSAAGKSNHYLICQGLIKVVLFCKNPLEEHFMEGILRNHIVGRTIRSYVLVLPAVATYVMYLLLGYSLRTFHYS